jgi:hypothetical protein
LSSLPVFSFVFVCFGVLKSLKISKG